MPTTAEMIEEWFTYHKPTDEQPQRYHEIREAAKSLALCIDRCCPDSFDKSDALRKLRETVMMANASIALEPPRGV